MSVAIIGALLVAGPDAMASMIGNFRQISPKQLQEIQKDPSTIHSLLYPEDGASDEPLVASGELLDVDKAWHGLHFLLTGDPWTGKPPLAYAVLGGKEIGDDVGYGPVRFLTSEQVREASQALAVLPADELRKRFDPAQFKQADIYPEIWDENDEALTYLLENYLRLVQFYQNAAAKGNAVLFYLN
ncbi:MAG: YfbM family protein [Candidatus Omnitrophica bacterium]|nr:YfbM family protein [Candidatus Omnitrophota bacterium]